MPKGSNNRPGKSTKMDEHRQAAIVEDVQFLMSNGMSIDLICTRLGRKKDTLEAAYRRRGEQPPWQAEKKVSA